LKECNKLMAELQMWLRDAKRRLEQANNEEVQLKVKHTLIYVNAILCQVHCSVCSVSFEVFRALKIQIVVLLVLTLFCNLVGGYQCFREAYCLHLQG
jgi:hypothetical protein